MIVLKSLYNSIKTEPFHIFTFAAGMAIFFINENILKEATTSSFNFFCNCYLNDLFAGPILLSYTNILLGMRDKRLKNLPLTLLYCFAAGLVWEYVAPFVKPQSVPDIWDIICYLTGGFAYWIIYRYVILTKKNKKTA